MREELPGDFLKELKKDLEVRRKMLDAIRPFTLELLALGGVTEEEWFKATGHQL